MIEPQRLKETAQRYENENIKFRTYLKNRAKPKDLDRHFAALHKELFAEYDCCTCNNCCRQYAVFLTNEDAERIAGFLRLSPEDFRQNYLQECEDGYSIEPPCPFLEQDGKCRVQECKPVECLDFPYTDKPDRFGSLYSVIEFAQSCPVVFELIHRLKRLYGFRSGIR